MANIVVAAAKGGGCWSDDDWESGKDSVGITVWKYTIDFDWCGDGKWMTSEYKHAKASSLILGWSYKGDTEYSIYGSSYHGQRWNIWKAGGEGHMCLVEYFSCVQNSYPNVDFETDGAGHDWYL